MVGCISRPPGGSQTGPGKGPSAEQKYIRVGKGMSLFLQAADTFADTNPSASSTNTESGTALACREWSSAARARVHTLVWMFGICF